MTLSSDVKERPVWPWSQAAIRAFVTAATRQGQRFHILSGLDAALLVDLPGLNEALTRFRVDLLTGSSIKPRNITFQVPESEVSVTPEGKAIVSIKITRELLLDLLALAELPETVDPNTNGKVTT